MHINALQTTFSQKDFTNTELNSRLQHLVSSERKITQEILELINLVELRDLHLKMGFSSVFEYLTKYLGYNESSAYRRMQAARLLKSCPEVKESLQSGKLHLTQMAQLQSAIKAEQKQTKTVIDSQAKLALVKKLENKTSQETQKILTQELPSYEPVVAKPIQHKKDESVVLTLHLSREQYETLMQAKDLLSHIGNGNAEEIITNLCQKEIQRRHPRAKLPDLIMTVSKPESATNLRRKIFHNDQCCQYKDPLTGKTCGSKFQLQIDHRIPKWAGGRDSEANLQLLCGAHNRFKYQQEAGIRKT